MSSIAFSSTTLNYGKLFIFEGTFSYDPMDAVYGFIIDNIDFSGGTLAGADSPIIDLKGTFA